MPTRLHNRATLAGITLVVAAIAAPSSSAAQEFSADVVTTPARGTNTMRLYVGKTKLRVQTLQGGQSEGSAIWDLDQHSMIIVMDQNRTYIGGTNSVLANAMMNGAGTPAMWRFFRPTNANDPCTDWNAIVLPYAQQDSANRPHFTCKSLGNDAVNGRAAQKWAVTSTNGNETRSGYAWIDSKLHVVSKSQDESSTMELANIKEGAQPDSVFAIPAGYTQLDERALLARMKSGAATDSTIAAMLGAAAKDVGKDAASSTENAAKDKAKESTKKGIKRIIHIP